MGRILSDGGVRAMLTFLNGLTDHRFTALYRFDGETLKNLHLVDSDNPGSPASPDIPVMASYCLFVRNTRQKFALSDALHDERVADHPKRREMQSYCGVPLLDEDGRMFGTICHFDFRSIPISDANVALLEEVAPLLLQTELRKKAA